VRLVAEVRGEYGEQMSIEIDVAISPSPESAQGEILAIAGAPITGDGRRLVGAICGERSNRRTINAGWCCRSYCPKFRAEDRRTCLCRPIAQACSCRARSEHHSTRARRNW
jgi:hypothetical protein